LLVRPKKVVFGEDFCFAADVHYTYASFLRATLTDRRKILHFGQK